MKTKQCVMQLGLFLLGLGSTPWLQAQVFTNLHNFSASDSSFINADGARPIGGLVIANGALYGTTAYGGNTTGLGVVFKLDFNGANFSVIHAFDPNNYLDGFSPNAGLVLANGVLYGTAAGNTPNGEGFIFTVGSDGSTYTPLFDFIYPGYYDAPAGLIISSNIIYGISTYGGATGYYGSVFRVNTDQGGLTNLYSFATAGGINYTNKDGANPRSTMVLVGDTLYGTAELGGTNGCGTLFSLKTDGTQFKVIHTFVGGSNDGKKPSNYLFVSGDTLYGTTQNGGTGYGTVFKINTNGTGYQVIYFFQGGGDGGDPYGGVIESGNKLYGMAGIDGLGISDGSFFSLNTNGTGFKTLLSVPAGPGGVLPGGNFYNNLIMSGNILYGTARLGGTGTNGFVFSITLPAPPSLSIVYAGNKAVVSWPPAFTNWTLQTNGSLATATWSDYTGPVVNNTVTNSLPKGNLFYRLKQ